MNKAENAITVAECIMCSEKGLAEIINHTVENLEKDTELTVKSIYCYQKADLTWTVSMSVGIGNINIEVSEDEGEE